MPVVFINLYWIYHANTKGMNVMLDSWGMYIIKIIYLNWIYSANIWGIYDSWRVSVRPPGAGLGNMFQLNKYISVGYILPTFGGYMAVGGFN